LVLTVSTIKNAAAFIAAAFFLCRLSIVIEKSVVVFTTTLKIRDKDATA